MRKRKYFETDEDYIRYLEHRVQKLELCEEYHNNNNSDETSHLNTCSSFFEMATLRKSRSGLPVNLYLDDSGSYIEGGHAPRIKFQSDKGNSPNTRSMIPMTISDTPIIPINNYQNMLDGIGNKEISLIKKFVIANKTILLRLCNRNDEYDISDFLNDMKKV